MLSLSKCLLAPRTMYHFRVAYDGVVGKTLPSNSTTFTTGDYALGPVRFDLAAYFNRDVVANLGDTTNDPFGGDAWYLVAAGFDGTMTPNPDSPGLPDDRIVGDHLLGGYDEPNAIQVRPGAKGAIRVEVPRQKYGVVRFLVSGWAGAPRVPVVFEYGDDTSDRRVIPCDWSQNDPGGFVPLRRGLRVAARGLATLHHSWLEGETANLFEATLSVDPEKELVAFRLELSEVVDSREGSTFNLFAATGVRLIK